MRSEVWIAEVEGAPPKVTFIKRVAEIWRDQGLEVQHFAAATSPAGDLAATLEAVLAEHDADRADEAANAAEQGERPDLWEDEVTIATHLIREAAQALRYQSTGVTGEVGELIAWLEDRAQPDSGLDYGDNSRGIAYATVHGYDAAFVAEHFHGKGAAHLAALLRAALSAQERG